MQYPFQIDLNITQEDFIKVEILEQTLETQLAKKDSVKSIAMQVAIFLIASIGILSIDVIANEALYLVLLFTVLAISNFLYMRFYGYENDFKLATSHLINSHQQGNIFFTAENGMVIFDYDKCEYLTNEQRRFFSYDYVKHIKETNDMYIFVMRQEKELNLKGFLYMIIPKRNLDTNQNEKIQKISSDITTKYNLTNWVNSPYFDIDK